MKLELFYQSYCPYCRLVLSQLEKLELESYITLKSTTEAENAKFHQDKTGRNTVPCLYIDDSPMFESADIVEWLKANADQIKG